MIFSENIDLILKQSYENFKEFLIRPDDKERLVDPFIERLSNLMEKRSIITSKDRKLIFDEIDEFSDKLWDIIEERKMEAINYRLEIMNGISEFELSQNIFESVSNQVMIELEKLVRLCNLISNFHHEIYGDEELRLEIPHINLDKKEAFNDIFDILDSHFTSFISAADQLQLELAERQELKVIYLSRVDEIKTWASQQLLTLKKKVEKVYEILDNWITDSVTGENALVNSLIQHWKYSLNERRKIEVKSLESNTKVLDYLRPTSE